MENDFSTYTYIGDGVYANWDGFGIELRTNDGYGWTNAIYVEPEVLMALNAFYKRELKR